MLKTPLVSFILSHETFEISTNFSAKLIITQFTGRLCLTTNGSIGSVNPTYLQTIYCELIRGCSKGTWLFQRDGNDNISSCVPCKIAVKRRHRMVSASGERATFHERPFPPRPFRKAVLGRGTTLARVTFDGQLGFLLRRSFHAASVRAYGVLSRVKSLENDPARFPR